MSKEIVERIARIAGQLEEQLKFYREIGVADIGSAARSLKVATGATSEVEQAEHPAVKQRIVETSLAVPLSLNARDEEAMPKKKDQTGQSSLFGDLFADAEPASTAASLPVIQPQDASLEAIREDIGECTRCKLHLHRTNIVFGEGSPQAELVFIGEGPGADEDATGRPFVGRAGQLLDKIIGAIGMKREDCYIANVVKCFISPRVQIYTTDGYKPIKDIRVGDLVLTHTGRFRRVIYVRPKEVLPSGSQVVRLTISPPGGGKPLRLTVTPEHPFLINGKWKTAREIKEGDRVLTLGDCCEVCGKTHFVRYDRYDARTYRTCGPTCHNKRVMHSPETREKIRQIMHQQYAEGLRDPIAITSRANERTRELVSAGAAKIQRMTARERYRSRITLAERITAGQRKGVIGYGELELKAILEQISVEYIHHFAFPGSAFTYDFCFPQERILIEVRGPGFSNKDVQERALVKDSLAEEAGYLILSMWWLEIVRHPEMIKRMLERLLENHRDEYVFVEAIVAEVEHRQTKRDHPLYNIGIEEDESYVAAGIVSHNCRPPGNRTPERDETATCEQFLFRQLAFLRPKVIVALGSPAFQCLLRTKETISKSRGQWREWNGIKIMPTFHPAYLLRTPEKKREVWDDMKKVRDYLNSLTD